MTVSGEATLYWRGPLGEMGRVSFVADSLDIAIAVLVISAIVVLRSVKLRISRRQ